VAETRLNLQPVRLTLMHGTPGPPASRLGLSDRADALGIGVQDPLAVCAVPIQRLSFNARDDVEQAKGDLFGGVVGGLNGGPLAAHDRLRFGGREGPSYRLVMRSLLEAGFSYTPLSTVDLTLARPCEPHSGRCTVSEKPTRVGDLVKAKEITRDQVLAAVATIFDGMRVQGRRLFGRQD